VNMEREATTSAIEKLSGAREATQRRSGRGVGREEFGRSLSAQRSWCPEFFAIGPARTASTWLHNVLAPHVNLPLTVKETRFLDNLYRRGWRWYRAQFGSSLHDAPFGEIAPTYFHSNLVRARIKKHAPNARIMCTLRDPVERLYSLFRYLRFRASNNWTFEYALTHNQEMIESPRYGHYLKAWINDFGRSNVLVTVYDDIEHDPQTYINEICDFIQIPRFALPVPQQARVNVSQEMRAPSSYALLRMCRFMSTAASALRWRGAFRLAKRTGLRQFFFGKGQELPPLEPLLAAELRKRLMPEIEEVEHIIGRDLSSWKG
jgi:Sulfotransferase family